MHPYPRLHCRLLRHHLHLHRHQNPTQSHQWNRHHRSPLSYHSGTLQSEPQYVEDFLGHQSHRIFQHLLSFLHLFLWALSPDLHSWYRAIFHRPLACPRFLGFLYLWEGVHLPSPHPRAGTSFPWPQACLDFGDRTAASRIHTQVSFLLPLAHMLCDLQWRAACPPRYLAQEIPGSWVAHIRHA